MKQLKKIIILITFTAFFTIHSSINISFIISFLRTDPIPNFLKDILVQQFFATSEFI